jgi:DNA-binding SARP family transcriptional activator
MHMDGKITYHQQVSFCGKPRCRRCREGIGHGPYWYAYKTINGRTVRTYIGKEAPPEVLAAQEEAEAASSSEFSTTLLRLYVLGQFRLEQRVEGQNGAADRWEAVTEASLQHQRVRSLLNCLVSSPGRKLAREQVLYMLWPELDVETASHRLDRAVYTLRQIFEPGRARAGSSKLLQTDHSTLTLADQSLLWIDADAFETLVSHAWAVQEQDPGQAEQLLEEAAQLYCGDFLADEKDLPHAQARRTSLHRAWIGMLLALADLRIAREAMPGAIDALDRLLATDPANEAAVQRLIALLAQVGRRSEAIAVYQRFTSEIKEHYKIQPLPETRALYEGVLRGQRSTVRSSVVRKMETEVRIEAAKTETRVGDGETEPASVSPSLSFTSSSPFTITSSNPTSPTAPANPTNPYRVASPSGSMLAVLPPHMHIGRTQQSPLVGRDKELARLRELLEITEATRRLRLAGQKKTSQFSAQSMSAQHRPQCVVLIGDVGIGKTRLAEEAAREAKRRDWAVAWCRTYTQESNVPYRVWTETLRKAMSQGLWQRQEVTRRPLIYQPLRTLLPELQDLLPASMRELPPLPDQEQLRLWESTHALLSTICENSTLLIVLDDLQWADTSSCELLLYLVRQMRNQPVMFLCTCRDSEVPRGHHLHPLLFDLQRERAVELIPVPRLSDDEISELLAHLPTPVVKSISERASGNPFFAEELARSIAGSTLDAALDAADPRQLPDTIQAVLDLRLARITEKCQRILERGAVLGRSFELDTILDMASSGARADEDEILELLEEALQAGMLTEEGSGMDITYHFWHPLLLTYLYERLSFARRASLHRKAAQVLQNRYAGREVEEAARIADHLVKGGGSPASIARYAELAADRAYSLSAYPDAEKHYRLVLEHLSPPTPSAPPADFLHRAYILERLGECTMIVGKFEEARSFYEQSLEARKKNRIFASEEEKKYEAQIEALIWGEIGQVWRYLDSRDKARESFKKGEEVLNNAGVVAGPAWARIRFHQSNLFSREGNLVEALVTANEALALVEASPARPQSADGSSPLTLTRRILNGDPLHLGRIYQLLGRVEGVSGQSTKSVKHFTAALNIFEQYGYQREIAMVCSDLGDIYLRKSEHDLAQAVFNRALDIDEKIGDAPNKTLVLGNLGVLAARLGDLPKAESWYHQALDLTESVNDYFYISLLQSYLAVALTEQGRLSEARPLLGQALKVGRSRHIAPCIGFALVALGRLYLTQANSLSQEERGSGLPESRKEPGNGRYGRLLLRARRALERALTYDGLEAETRCEGRLVLAEVALCCGELETAAQLAARTLEEAREAELTWLVAGAQRLLGRVLFVQGRYPEAVEHLRRALAIFERTGMRLERARTLWVYSAAVLALPSKPNSRQQALRYLQEARQLFAGCQAALDLRAAEALLDAQGTRAALK